MKKPLNKRLPRELKSEPGKYIVIFLFFVMAVSAVSGFLVADNSLIKAYDESFDKYNIEDGNFELDEKASDDCVEAIEKGGVELFENFYTEQTVGENDSTLRIFIKREDVNKECLMDGKFPQEKNEIAVDRMYADNNSIETGDTISVGGEKLKVTGLVALSDYSALFSNNNDLMFDSIKFGVGVMTREGFEENYGEKKIRYNYSWKYDDPPEDDTEAADMADALMKTVGENAVITDFLPRYTNQAIVFTGDDMGGDKVMISTFLYIIVVILAFIIAITTSNTISKESCVIGTLRATGYSRGELVRHYMITPAVVMLIAALIGNILGYTLLKDFFADMYYGSYSLPTFETVWNPEAFITTTVVPMILMLFINWAILTRKLSLSPLKFIRRDLSRSRRKKAFKLNTRIAIMKRFKLRIIFQNMPNYVTTIAGIFFAVFIVMFGFVFSPLLEKNKTDILENMFADYQYVLKVPAETETEDAEKYCAASLDTTGDSFKESVSVYGIEDDSDYIDIDSDGGRIFISSAYSEKCGISVGDTVKLKEKYDDDEYEFKVSGIYDYPSSLSIFMSREKFAETFDKESDYFNGYISNMEITDIDEKLIASCITEEDLIKVSRQLEKSMGNMMSIFLVFGVAMFLLIIYLLAKIIIEKNSQSISMTKILGYYNGEINGLYIHTTTIVVILSLLISAPLASAVMHVVMEAMFRQYPGWLPYYMPFITYVKTIALGVVSYAVVAALLTRQVKKVPLGEALKNTE